MNPYAIMIIYTCAIIMMAYTYYQALETREWYYYLISIGLTMTVVMSVIELTKKKWWYGH